MDIIRLKSFYEVVVTGSFTGAAERLFITQSAVSKHISSLEKELEIQLFNRAGKSQTLTDDGKRMLYYYSQILEIYDASVQELEQIKKSKNYATELRIIGGKLMMPYGIINAMMQYLEINPEVNLKVNDMSEKNVIFALNSGDYNLAFCRKDILEERYYSYQAYFSDDFIATVSADSEMAIQNEIFLWDLLDKEIVIRGDDRAFVEKQFRSTQSLNVVFETDDPATANEFLIHRKNVIFIAPRTIMKRYKGTLTKQIPIKGLDKCTYVFAWKKNALTGCAKKFLGFIREYEAEQLIEQSYNRKFEGLIITEESI